MSIPTFIIIGAQKSGTTSLYYWLGQHPQISMSLVEEVHYYDNEDRYPNPEWYRNQFEPDALSSKLNHNPKVYGEKTPIYCYWPASTISRIKAHNSDTKLIFMLRNPIERAISQYYMEFNRGDEHLPIEDAFSQEARRLSTGGDFAIRHYSYLSRGYYLEQLERVYQHFPAEQVYIRRFEDMIQAPDKILAELCQFLEIAPYEFDVSKRHRVGSREPLSFTLRQELISHFAPHNLALTQSFQIRTDDWQ